MNSMRHSRVLYCLVFTVVSMLHCQCSASGSEGDGLSDCGPHCVKYLSRYFYRPVSLEKAYELCDFRPKKSTGTSLLQIKTALEKLGLHCRGFTAEFESLLLPTFSGCAFVVADTEKTHYDVIAKRMHSDGWLWISPSQGCVTPLTQQFFAAKSSRGYAFLAVTDEQVNETRPSHDDVTTTTACQAIIQENAKRGSAVVQIAIDKPSTDWDHVEEKRVDIGTVEYGYSKTITLRFCLPDTMLDEVKTLKRVGCASAVSI